MKVLKIGSTGKEVVKLQNFLKLNGYNIIADGSFGAKTENIIEDFQDANNLVSDGVVGIMTWNLLFNVDATEKNFVINKTRYILPQKNYYNEIIEKRGITLHHTNGWTVKNGKPSMNSFNWWVSGDKHVSTAFTVDYEGNIYQHYESYKNWAYHLGLKNRHNKIINQEFVGIELCNEGYLTKENERFYWWSGKLKLKYNRPQDKPIHIPEGWRGYEWFAPYSENQIEATNWLVKYLCDNLNIEKKVIDDFEYHPELLNGQYNGIYSHCNIRENKFDISPAFNIKSFKKKILE